MYKINKKEEGVDEINRKKIVGKLRDVQINGSIGKFFTVTRDFSYDNCNDGVTNRNSKTNVWIMENSKKEKIIVYTYAGEIRPQLFMKTFRFKQPDEFCSPFSMPLTTIKSEKKIDKRFYVDGDLIYLKGKDYIIPFYDIDIATFESFGDVFSKDKNFVYYLNSVMIDVDADSFKSLGKNHMKDRRNVYYMNYKITTEVDTFQLLNDNYARSGSKIFFGDLLMSMADADTFRVMRPNYAIDKNHRYYRSRIEE